MFLHAFRYCDALFLEDEVRRIYGDFERLGYTKDFIDKANLSAREGRDREFRIREGIEQCNPPEKDHVSTSLCLTIVLLIGRVIDLA